MYFFESPAYYAPAGLGIVTQIVFLILKLTNTINWAWPVVLIPLTVLAFYTFTFIVAFPFILDLCNNISGDDC
jgi:hypothetical protein